MPEEPRPQPRRRPISAPDIGAAAFRAEASRQSRAVAASPGERDDQAFIDAISALDEEWDSA